MTAPKTIWAQDTHQDLGGGWWDNVVPNVHYEGIEQYTLTSSIPDHTAMLEVLELFVEASRLLGIYESISSDRGGFKGHKGSARLDWLEAEGEALAAYQQAKVAEE